jgi:hypothetical protein
LLSGRDPSSFHRQDQQIFHRQDQETFSSRRSANFFFIDIGDSAYIAKKFVIQEGSSTISATGSLLRIVSTHVLEGASQIDDVRY